jgi:hypothetical protein
MESKLGDLMQQRPQPLASGRLKRNRSRVAPVKVTSKSFWTNRMPLHLQTTFQEPGETSGEVEVGQTNFVAGGQIVSEMGSGGDPNITSEISRGYAAQCVISESIIPVSHDETMITPSSYHLDTERFREVKKFLRQPKCSIQSIIGDKNISKVKSNTIQRLSNMYLHTLQPSFENTQSVMYRPSFMGRSRQK